jgi:hypothetical protein
VILHVLIRHSIILQLEIAKPVILLAKNVTTNLPADVYHVSLVFTMILTILNASVLVILQLKPLAKHPNNVGNVLRITYLIKINVFYATLPANCVQEIRSTTVSVVH